MIETRGEGGFIILAPSNGKVHPSGGAYRLRAGGFATIPVLTADERRDLHQLARTFHQPDASTVERERSKPASSDAGVQRPGDAFNARASWADVLIPQGWCQVTYRGDVTHWRRPGKTIGISATTNYGGSDLLIVFSSSTPFETGRGYSKFSAFTILNHSGDFTAAARDLASGGYGEPDAVASVKIQGGKLSEVVNRAEAALLKNTTIYQRGGQLTRAIKLNAAIADSDQGREGRE